MLVNWLDDVLGLQLPQCLPRQTSIDFQSLHKNTHTHESVRADFLEEFVVCGFIEEDGIVGLVLDFAFRPLLLLGYTRQRRSRRGKREVRRMIRRRG